MGEFFKHAVAAKRTAACAFAQALFCAVLVALCTAFVACSSAPAKKNAERLAQLEKEKVIAGYKASYLAMGYDEALAADTANALAEGNDAKLFENQKKHQEAVEKKARNSCSQPDTSIRMVSSLLVITND